MFEGLTESQVASYAYILQGVEKSDKRCGEACPGLRSRGANDGWPPDGCCGGDRVEVSYDGQRLLERMRPCELKRADDIEAHYEQLLQGASIPGGTGHMTLANFRPTRGTKAAHQAACDFAEGRSDRGVVLAGPTGSGKTHLAIGVLRRWLERHQPGIFRTVPELLDTLRAAQRSNDNRADKIMDLLKTTPLLCLDDFGTEKGTEWGVERLFIIINARELSAAPMVATTNFVRPRDLAERLGGISGERIVSRLRGLCSWIQMDGSDLRVRPVGKGAGKDRDGTGAPAAPEGGPTDG